MKWIVRLSGGGVSGEGGHDSGGGGWHARTMNERCEDACRGFLVRVIQRGSAIRFLSFVGGRTSGN
jgi:hypothetical protein